jgi:hypothetical protein
MPGGSITLADVSRRFPMLEVRCGNCARSGRLSIDKLIEQHGLNMPLPDLRKHLAGDCEQRTARIRKDRCEVFYPQMRELRGA